MVDASRINKSPLVNRFNNKADKSRYIAKQCSSMPWRLRLAASKLTILIMGLVVIVITLISSISLALRYAALQSHQSEPSAALALTKAIKDIENNEVIISINGKRFPLKYGVYQYLDTETPLLRILNIDGCCKEIVAAQVLFYAYPKIMRNLGFQEVSLKDSWKNTKPFEAFKRILEHHIVTEENSENLPMLVKAKAKFLPDEGILKFIKSQNLQPTNEIKNLKTLYNQLQYESFKDIGLFKQLIAISADAYEKRPFFNPSFISLDKLHKYSEDYIALFTSYNPNDKEVNHTVYCHKDIVIDGVYAFRQTCDKN